MWFDESVFYQIYPLGYCGAERENDFGETRHRFGIIEEQIPVIRDLGFRAVLFNPLFESERHGYDTVDFFRVDRRLGTNEEFKALVDRFHEAGIRVVLDGVFNHTGRKFFAFEDVRARRESSAKKNWFRISFGGNSRYDDGFWYENWEGHDELVKLNLADPEVQGYLLDAVRYWIREFGIDGLRLDVSYLLPEWFFEMLRHTVRELRGDFFLMGEVIHIQNFARNLSPERLDSITNYECYKGLTSAVNADNFFEIQYSLERLFGTYPWCLYTGKNLFSFADNHDVPRAATALKDRRRLPVLYAVLYTMPGIPCVYYGSEYAAEGDKSDFDYKLRPYIGDIDRERMPVLTEEIRRLNGIRGREKALAYGSYEKCVLSNRYMCFRREYAGERIWCAFNISDETVVFHVGDGEAEDLLGGGHCSLAEFSLPPYSSKILKK